MVITEGPIDRDLGLMRADIDVHLLHDPKMLRLLQHIPDERERAITVVVYLETLLASWREGRRLSAEEAAGLWGVTPDRMTTLATVGLLDAEGRIPGHAWARWFERPRPKSNSAGRRARKAGLRSGVVRARKAASNDGGSKPSSNGRSTNVQRPPTVAEPSQPPPPTVADGVGVAGPMGGPPRRRVDMNDLEAADSEAIEIMLARLPEQDGRRRRLKDELHRREGEGSTGPRGIPGEPS